MTRKHILSVMILFVGLPAMAAAGSFFTSSASPCFANGSAGYRFGKSAADFTVKFDNGAANPDLRVQVISDPSQADFMLVDDDADQPKNACHGAKTISTIRVDASAGTPDLVVALSNDPLDAQYKLYVRSSELTTQHAAALFAVMWRAARPTDVAGRNR